MQNFLRRILPQTWFAAIERETKQWEVACPCGERRSLWEMGGVRYKARGNPKRRLHCLACNEMTWHRIRKRRKSDSEPVT